MNTPQSAYGIAGKRGKQPVFQCRALSLGSLVLVREQPSSAAQSSQARQEFACMTGVLKESGAAFLACHRRLHLLPGPLWTLRHWLVAVHDAVVLISFA